MTHRLAIAALVLATAAAGCGGDDSESDPGEGAPTSSSAAESAPAGEPEEAADPTSTVTVQLRDDRPLDALFNKDGIKCTTRDVAEAFDIAIQNPDLSARELRNLLPKTTVKLADATGTTVGVEELGADVGFFRQRGCSHSVTFFDVPSSEFFEVTVEHGEFSKTLDLEGGKGDVLLDVAF